jgi:hypothetical protein
MLLHCRKGRLGIQTGRERDRESLCDLTYDSHQFPNAGNLGMAETQQGEQSVGLSEREREREREAYLSISYSM